MGARHTPLLHVKTHMEAKAQISRRAGQGICCILNLKHTFNEKNIFLYDGGKAYTSPSIRNPHTSKIKDF